MRTAVVLLVLCAAVCTAAASGMVSPLPVKPSAPEMRSLELGAADHLSCATCVDIAKFATNLTASERATFIGLLQFECKMKLPNKNETKIEALCEALVKDLIDVLPWINKELSSLAWNVPLGFCSVFVPVCKSNCCEAGAPPEEVHLSLTHAATEMAVSWTTLNTTETSTVQWGTNGDLGKSSDGSANTHTYTDGGWVGTLHTAIMTGLEAGQTYSYRVGDDKAGWSETFSFTTFPSNIGTKERPLNFIQIGDTGFGDTSNETIATIIKMVDAGQVDMVLHVGDIGYADGFMTHWDVFLNKVQPIASRVPYMTTPGNHELWYDFMAYKNRFWMPMATPGTRPPAQETLMYYSFDVGPVHLVMYDTETWFDTANMDAAQLGWLKADLQATNEKRSELPWIIGAGHRPLYCSNGGTQCGLFASWLRYLAEDIFHDNRVDLIIQCHEHSMERSLPLYGGAVQQNNYTNPTAPVYVVNGAGGNREGNTDPKPEPWVQFHSAAVGFAYVQVTPESLNYQFHEAAGPILDQFTITKPPAGNQ